VIRTVMAILRKPQERLGHALLLTGSVVRW